MNLLLVIMSVLLFTSCHGHKVPVADPPLFASSPTYRIYEDAPGHFIVVATNSQTQAIAIARLCTQAFICTGPDELARSVGITRTPK